MAGQQESWQAAVRQHPPSEQAPAALLDPTAARAHLEARVVKVDVGQRGKGGGVQQGVDLGGHLHAWGMVRGRVGMGKVGAVVGEV